MIYQQQTLSYTSSDFFEEKIYLELEKNYENIQKLLDILKERIKIFEISKLKKLQKTESNNNISNKLLKKQRGRPKKNEELKNISIHSKMSFDNICQKLKVLYHHFLINLCNDFIKNSYKGFQKFRIRKVSSSITQNVTKKYNQTLSKWNLKQFFSNQISSKYKRFSENKNEENINKLCFFKPKIKELFMMNYFDVYKNYFIYGNRNELINKYGISNKTLLFEDCLNKIKKKENEDYIQKMNNIAKGKFMTLLENGKDNNINYYSSDYSTDNNSLCNKKRKRV